MSLCSERMLMEQLRYNLLFRWFVGIAIDGRTTRRGGYALSLKTRAWIETHFGWVEAVAGLRQVKRRDLARVEALFQFVDVGEQRGALAEVAGRRSRRVRASTGELRPEGRESGTHARFKAPEKPRIR